MNKPLHTLTFRLLLVISLSFFYWNQSFGQISQGGKPLFLQSRAAKSVKAGTQAISIPKFSLPVMNNDSLLLRDMSQKGYKKGVNFAAAVKVDLNTNNSGIWKTLPNGDQVWLLEIESKNASSLNFVLDYELKPGAKLFLYNKSTGQILGAYTDANNKPWKRLAIQPISGEKICLEYHVPNKVSKGILAVKTVGHGYLKSFTPSFDKEYSHFGMSKECQPDINGIQGQAWQNEKRSVVKIVIQRDANTFSMSTGALINNSKQDKTPYVLTCEHSLNGYSREEDYTPSMGAENSIYFFNYESIEIGQDGDQSQSVSGAILRATKPNLDFALVELSEEIPAAYKPYFAGWDRRKQEFEYCVGISHPKGDVKKIAKSISRVIPDQTFHEDEPYLLNTHYEVDGWKYGQLEGGSSGSPLFNPDHRIVGDLSGGTDQPCGEEDKEVSDYQMMFYSWDNSEVPSQQLKYWLDPNDSGVEFMDGLDPYQTDKVYFYPNKDLTYMNEEIIFKNQSIGSYTNYRWDFGEKATPQTATGSNPVSVSYSETGIYSASLTVTNSKGEDKTFTLKDGIEVFYRSAEVDFEANKKSALTGESIIFTNLSTGSNTAYEWDFGEGAEPRTLTTSSADPISVVYSSTGTKDIVLTVRNPLGDKIMSSLKYLSIGEELTSDYTIDPAPYFVGENVSMKSVSDKWKGFGYGCYWSINDQMVSENKAIEFNYKFNEEGKYKISFTVYSDYDEDTKEIEIDVVNHINTAPVISVINGNAIECSVSEEKQNETYHWDFGDGSSSDQSQVEHEYAEIGTYDVILSISNEYETKEITTKINITSLPTGIDDNSLSGIELKVYPNPATEFVNIQFPREWKNTTIQVYSLNGRLLLSKIISEPNCKINCNQLKKGLILIVLTNENERITKKVIVN